MIDKREPEMMELEPKFINRNKALVLMSDDSILPVAEWLDDDGEFCGPDDAVVAVAGPDLDDLWHVMDLRGFDPVALN